MRAALTRRQFGLAVGAAAGGALLRGQERSSVHPNVLLLITDQQSNAATSATDPRVRTPAIDSLAADGVTFHNSYCTYPVCSPSRSSLFTGRMPHETDVRVNGRAIAAGIPAIGEMFRAAGYHTVYGGKWHLPKGFEGMTGFEKIAGGESLGARMDATVAAACIEYLKTAGRRPFLMVASFMNPHDICEWIRGYEGNKRCRVGACPSLPLNMAVDSEEPEYIQRCREVGNGPKDRPLSQSALWTTDDFRLYLDAYYRFVEDADRQIGRILSALRAAGLCQRTFVIMTSDHGEGMGAHHWVEKAAFWEETVKVPLVVAGHGVHRRGARDSASLVSGLDILPTVCDYAGVAPPRLVRGRSLRPAIDGSALDRRFVVSELSQYGGEARQGRMLRTARYKYVAFNGGRRPEQLFDLDHDPGEIRNLASDAAFKDVLHEHRQLLAKWVAETADDFVIEAQRHGDSY